MRNAEAIVARIAKLDDDGTDFFGTVREGLIMALPYRAAQQWLNPDVTEDGWEAESRTGTDEKVRAAMADYMPFAIGKACDHRGLSANRSVDHYRGWAWLLSDIEYAALEAAPYAQYGVPQLKVAAYLCGYVWPTGSPTLDRMADGVPCRPDGCDEGCE